MNETKRGRVALTLMFIICVAIAGFAYFMSNGQSSDESGGVTGIHSVNPSVSDLAPGRKPETRKPAAPAPRETRLSGPETVRQTVPQPVYRAEQPRVEPSKPTSEPPKPIETKAKPEVKPEIKPETEVKSGIEKQYNDDEEVQEIEQQ